MAFSWAGDSSKWSQAQKLASLDPDVRRKVKATIDDLKRAGWQPYIVFAWRSPAVQARLKAQGKSQVDFSFHNATDPAGEPASQAGDIVDARYWWATSADGTQDPVKEAKAAAFFKALGATGRRYGLYWGGDWSKRGVWAKYGIGWDPAHLQGQPNSALARVKAAAGSALERVSTAGATSWPWLFGLALALGLGYAYSRGK